MSPERVSSPSPQRASGSPPAPRALELRIRGVVQGVGFRPFVHRLALRHGVRGWVKNEAGSVHVLAEGEAASLEAFTAALRTDAPPLARIDDLVAVAAEPTGAEDFRVVGSDLAPRGRLPVSPDVAVCPACAAELHDPSDRRFRYPFITCTDCGPRFTVIEAMPYDRERSTMSVFAQCPECLREYREPADRRYHSQTNSCPACGPRVWLESEGNVSHRGDGAIRAAGELVRHGRTVAVRGLGGFHLACDATDDVAVRRLRERKHREAKPLAIMVRRLDEARALAWVSDDEAALLESRERPIVVLERRPDVPLAPSLAPGLGSVGIMLAYTPLHLLLLEEAGRPLLMTSGNASDEPIATGLEEARARLGGIADAFLLHDREIVARYDDSLVRASTVGTVFLRRARGYAPLPVPLPVPAARPFLAVGPHLKNTLALAQDDTAWISQHVGDLENLETLEHWQAVLHRFKTLFRLEPEAVVRDLHPGYLSTRLAQESGLAELPPVQHHHAHIAAVQGEHGVRDDVLGLAFDGTGWGEDERVWGAEFLRSGLTGFRRLGRLRYAPLPGGDAAARAPWRTALGYLSLAGEADSVGAAAVDATFGPAFEAAFRDVPSAALDAARRQIERGVNAPEASSLGRLFDAAAAVLGVRSVAAYEGQAPMELEALAGVERGEALPFPAERGADGIWVLDPLPLLAELGARRARGQDVRTLAAAFHESVSEAAASLAVSLCGAEGLDTVALGGGCFQNVRLLAGVSERIRRAGIRVLVPRLLGPNDGAVSYGQAVVAAARMDTQGPEGR